MQDELFSIQGKLYCRQDSFVNFNDFVSFAYKARVSD